MNRRPLERWMERLAAVGPVAFLAIATVEGGLRAEYSSIAEPISALALGPRGWIQQLDFALLAVSFISLSLVLRKQLRPGVVSVSAPVVFLVMGLGVAGAGLFNMDAPGAPPTLVGRLHELSGFLVFPWMPVVTLLAARRFRRDPDWRSYFGYTLATGLFIVATLAFFLIFVGVPSSPPRAFSEFRGVVQRVMLAAFFAWTASVAYRVHGRAQADRRDRVPAAAGGSIVRALRS